MFARSVLSSRGFSTTSRNNMRIVPVPVRTDNYAYLLIDEPSNVAAAVDPYDAKKVIEAAKKEGVSIGKHVITTHHHNDHSGGNKDFLSSFNEARVYGGSEKCSGLTDKVVHSDTFKIGENIHVKCYATPCHTQDSICFFVEDKEKNQRGVFTGDTLFISGCGRFFEGNAAEMDKALNTTLAGLPDDTIVYCGHEYTAANVAFSSFIEPNNPAIKSLKEYCASNSVTTGKFTIGDEKQHNVFMRLGSEAVQEKTKQTEPIKVMAELRELKNNFRG